MKRATSVIDNCINKTDIKCGTLDNVIKQLHIQRVSTTGKAEIKKSGTAKSMFGQKSGLALAGLPTMALLVLHYLTFSSLTNTPCAAHSSYTRKRVLNYKKIDKIVLSII